MNNEVAYQKIRTSSGKIKTVPRLTRGQAIKCFCTSCLGWGTPPKDCKVDTCPLFHFRGKMLLGNDKSSEGDE